MSQRLQKYEHWLSCRTVHVKKAPEREGPQGVGSEEDGLVLVGSITSWGEEEASSRGRACGCGC